MFSLTIKEIARKKFQTQKLTTTGRKLSKVKTHMQTHRHTYTHKGTVVEYIQRKRLSTKWEEDSETETSYFSGGLELGGGWVGCGGGS